MLEIFPFRGEKVTFSSSVLSFNLASPVVVTFDQAIEEICDRIGVQNCFKSSYKKTYLSSAHVFRSASQP